MITNPSTSRRYLGRSPVVEAALLTALRAGHTMKSAALIVGVGRNTLLKWRHDDPVFAAAIEAARADGVAKVVADRLAGLARSLDSAAP